MVVAMNAVKNNWNMLHCLMSMNLKCQLEYMTCVSSQRDPHNQLFHCVPIKILNSYVLSLLRYTSGTLIQIKTLFFVNNRFCPVHDPKILLAIKAEKDWSSTFLGILNSSMMLLIGSNVHDLVQYLQSNHCFNYAFEIQGVGQSTIVSISPTKNLQLYFCVYLELYNYATVDASKQSHLLDYYFNFVQWLHFICNLIRKIILPHIICLSKTMVDWSRWL